MQTEGRGAAAERWPAAASPPATALPVVSGSVAAGGQLGDDLYRGSTTKGKRKHIERQKERRLSVQHTHVPVDLGVECAGPVDEVLEVDLDQQLPQLVRGEVFRPGNVRIGCDDRKTASSADERQRKSAASTVETQRKA